MTKIRLAHISDSHFTKGGRLAELAAVHQAFVDHCRHAKVDFILHTGDLYDKPPVSEEWDAAAEFLCNAGDVAKTIVVGGNHDRPKGVLNVLNRLRANNRIVAFQEHHVVQLPNATVIGFPWIDKATLVSTLPADVPASATTNAVIERMNYMLTLLRVQADEAIAQDKIPVFASHCLIQGCETSTGQTLIGTTVGLSPSSVFGVGCPYNAVGHIHKEQTWGFQNQVLAYSGSSIRQNFGEPEDKGFYLVEIEMAAPSRWTVNPEFIQLPARKIELIEVDATEAENPMQLIDWIIGQRHVAEALVRVRYNIRPERLHSVDTEALTALLQSRGAHEIKIEAVLAHEARIRSEEIATAETLWDEVQAYFTAKQLMLDDVELDGIKGLLGSIQEEVLHAAA
ncbi:MAG: metallophosphoesterase family protein [Blastocatellia bacterium]